MTRINPDIFRAYDIRGSSLSDITQELSYKIGFCFAKMVCTKENNKVSVARDGRLSSNSLYDALLDGLNHCGGSCISIGVMPTPALYFATNILKTAGSVRITGSHNPKDDNGFKLLKNGNSFFGEDLQKLYRLIITCDFS